MKNNIKEKNINITKPELLAPAGDLERLKIACLYGADAVYVGGTLFGLRANAINFTIDDLVEGVNFAHNLNKKVYVTVNVVLHNKELGNLVDYLRELDKIGVDAIIVSDPTVIELAKRNTNLEIHLSTQQSTLNYEAASYWKKEGVSRIVLARETSLEDIILIKDKVDIELESFIHGAMCASYSGRCVLSNFLTDRDSNRGGCSQICRWNFDLQDENHNDIKGDKDFTFCTKDLSMLKYIPQMVDAKITSFKIEGRMRSLYYIATVVDIYRKEIDRYWKDKENYTYNDNAERILRNCANRDSVPQFINHVFDSSCQYYNGRVEVSNQDFLGIVLDYNPVTKEATIEQRNYFKTGDKVEIFGPSIDVFEFEIGEIKNTDDEIIDVSRHPKEIVRIKVPYPVYKYDMMRIKKI